ncbi:MAG TPA: ISAs1 family transposase [Thermoanaerobaculaceae bacterium]|nr:ISAs1 family transposase [Thermoanaerobaculaceae bacterium]
MDNAAEASDARRFAAEMLQKVTVRPVRQEEVPRWRSLMRNHHYLGLRSLVGETLYYVAEVEGRWVALLGWGAAALKVAARDRWIGWSAEQREKRLRFVTQNARFLLLPGPRVPNLASRILALNLHRLSTDWQSLHGHPIVLVETFVDPQRFEGTCYRAAGWTQLGATKGFGREGAGYCEHGEPKNMWVRPLCRQACAWLRAPFEVPALQGPATDVIDLNALPLSGRKGLLAVLATVPDARKRRGIRHSQVSVLAVAVCAVLAGHRGFRAMADFAASLTQDVLARLEARRCPHTGRRVAPSEPTLRRILERVDADALDRALGRFFASLTPVKGIAIDGKTLRGSGQDAMRPRHILAAVTHHSAVMLAQREIPDKTNEITHARPLLDELDLRGKVVTADAMHTQREFASYLVDEKGADFVFTAKDNQRQLRRSITTLPDWALSPPVHGTPQGPRSDREADNPAKHSLARSAAISSHRAGLPPRAGT